MLDGVLRALENELGRVGPAEALKDENTRLMRQRDQIQASLDSLLVKNDVQHQIIGELERSCQGLSAERTVIMERCASLESASKEPNEPVAGLGRIAQEEKMQLLVRLAAAIETRDTALKALEGALAERDRSVVNGPATNIEVRSQCG